MKRFSSTFFRLASATAMGCVCAAISAQPANFPYSAAGAQPDPNNIPMYVGAALSTGVNSAQTEAPMLLVAPEVTLAEPLLAHGCWVRLFPEPEFKGIPSLTIVGPLHIPSLRSPTGGRDGVYWRQKTQSLLVGHNAFVTIYENSDYGGLNVALKPATQMPYLKKDLQFTHSIDSMVIACAD